MDYRHPNQAFNKSEEERKAREATPPSQAQKSQWEKETKARRDSITGKLPYSESTPETERAFWEQNKKDHQELLDFVAKQQRESEDKNNVHRDPDMWSEKVKMEKIMAWRKKYARMSYMDLYEALLKDEGYWYQVNGLIQNLPPEPGRIHSSVDDTFYTMTVPWAGVRVDWLDEIPVVGDWVTPNDLAIRRRLVILYREKHARPQGMGIELSYLNARHKTSNIADNLTSGPSITTVIFGLGALAISLLFLR